MTEEQILQFLEWLETQNMQICGPVFDWVSGTNRMTALDDKDRSTVAKAFIAEKKGQ